MNKNDISTSNCIKFSIPNNVFMLAFTDDWMVEAFTDWLMYEANLEIFLDWINNHENDYRD